VQHEQRGWRRSSRLRRSPSAGGPAGTGAASSTGGVAAAGGVASETGGSVPADAGGGAGSPATAGSGGTTGDAGASAPGGSAGVGGALPRSMRAVPMRASTRHPTQQKRARPRTRAKACRPTENACGESVPGVRRPTGRPADAQDRGMHCLGAVQLRRHPSPLRASCGPMQPGAQECTSSTGIRVCGADGTWTGSVCATSCRSSALGAFCADANAVVSYTTTIQYEARGPNPDLTDWSSTTVVEPAPELLVVSYRGDTIIDARERMLPGLSPSRSRRLWRSVTESWPIWCCQARTGRATSWRWRSRTCRTD